MGLLEADKEKIRSVLLDEEFLNFMFEMLIGNKYIPMAHFGEKYTHMKLQGHMLDLSKLLIYIFLIKYQ